MIQYTKEYIGQLLERYMEGISTLEEEDILHQFFTRSDVPAEWEDYRMLFAEIDSMRPTEKHDRRWWPWSIAAAVAAALVVFTITQRPQENQPKSDVTAQVEEKDSVTIPKAVEARPDSTLPKYQQQAPSSTKRRLRKPQPTMTDYDKAYTLMAEAAKEQQQAEQEMDQAQQEILHTQLTAAGYVAIQQEDGTIIYTNEPKEYFAYEE